ncbi:STAS domain-containing protein [Limisalsivibrio acetivorans]|uniref:STAS domain-containing protein n=1 Tax=Limisalsivibrio acetivorans TaxID=1304888 RepID=UPI0003B5DBCE|nr:STAS domain-containing protein [Limisalsivibrio acetivorans]
MENAYEVVFFNPTFKNVDGSGGLLMKISMEEFNGFKVMHVAGKVDILTSSEIRAKLSESAKAKVEVLIVDLAKVVYMDSSGLATFLEGLKSMKEYGGVLRLVNIPERIDKVLKLMKLDQVFEIYDSVEEAAR